MVACLPDGSLCATVSCRRRRARVERESSSPSPRERAWELVTEPAELREWLADDVEFEAEEGAPLRVTWDGGEPRGRRRGRSSRGARRLPLGRLARRVAPRRRSRRHALHGDRAALRRTTAASGARSSTALAAAAAARARRDRRAGGAVFAALADPTRRAIVRSLARAAADGVAAGRRAADDPPGRRQAPRRPVRRRARHGRREGRETRYTLTPAPLAEAIEWMTDVGAPVGLPPRASVEAGVAQGPGEPRGEAAEGEVAGATLLGRGEAARAHPQHLGGDRHPDVAQRLAAEDARPRRGRCRPAAGANVYVLVAILMHGAIGEPVGVPRPVVKATTWQPPATMPTICSMS